MRVRGCAHVREHYGGCRLATDHASIWSARTVDEPRAEHSSIRDTKVVHKTARTIDRVCERSKVARSRRGTHVPEVLAVRLLLAALPDLEIFLLHNVRLRIERVEVALVPEGARHFNAGELDRVVKESVEVVRPVEAIDLTRAVRSDDQFSSSSRARREELGASLHGERADAARIPRNEVVLATSEVVEQRGDEAHALQARASWSSCRSGQ